tara:strand:- start:176 stop:1432 length:1257 start_codon:yes stop_codon:yes gene_type:complete
MLKKYIYIIILFSLSVFSAFLIFDYSFKVNVHKLLITSYDKLISKEKKYEIYQDKIDQGYLSSKFGELKLTKIKLSEKDFNVPLGYIELVKNNIVFFRTDGDLIILDKDFNKQKIKNNITNYFNKDLDEKYYENKEYPFDPFVINPIRDILYHEGFLYVVLLSKEIIDQRLGYTTIVLKGKFNLNNIDFEYFFKPDHFAFGKIDTWHTGGRLAVDDKNKFFLAVPDYGKINLINNKKSIFGKVIKIKSINDYEIISQGHRNPQGLYFDMDEKILLESEHGPASGDEVNIIKKDKNYGWPSTSIGTHDDYVKFHNHSKKGFEEPAYAWTPHSSGASQITKVNHSSKFKFKDHYIVSTLSGKNYYYGNHLYIFKIEGNKVKMKDKIYIADRVRDIHYDKNNDRIILSLENEESIAIIEVN